MPAAAMASPPLPNQSLSDNALHHMAGVEQCCLLADSCTNSFACNQFVSDKNNALHHSLARNLLDQFVGATALHHNAEMMCGWTKSWPAVLVWLPLPNQSGACANQQSLLNILYCISSIRKEGVCHDTEQSALQQPSQVSCTVI